MTRPLYKHDHLSPTKRGWLFMGNHGGFCNMKCVHCYYAFQPNLVFFHPETLIAHANKFRYHYGLEYCDISGGDATVFGKFENGRRPEMEMVLCHCANIGLKPTVITHGQSCTEILVKTFEEAGLEDWLISMHGMAEGHDKTVVNHVGKGAGGWEKLVNNLKYMTRPIRFNTTLLSHNYRELPAMAKYFAENHPPTVWNLINFNPFFAWAGREVIEFQEKFSTLAPYVADAVMVAEAAGWEVNCRYFAPCVAQQWGFAKNCIGYYQTQYDPWEWNIVATERVPMRAVEQLGGMEAACRALIDQAIAKPRANSKCNSCALHPICEGVSEQYQKRFGIDELLPIVGEKITDITHFERN